MPASKSAAARDTQGRASPRPWFLYVLRCRDGALYTGVTTDVTRRYAQHAAGKGARYTRLNPPQALALVLVCAGRSEALKAEYAFKRLDRAAKLDFLNRHAPADGDFSVFMSPPPPATQINQP
ncbi:MULTISPECIES: GIY-YIG nuclease family protein [Chromobacterium]|uniref:GIY-YIG nuclease family protein n=1 Tax=Chromobacterium rhizoryzae TaxID=1778675 RepID=A0AAD0RNS4_9NEIS|nr:MULTISPECIES: GIY-YIG nuclease family protein [Chromobacterium]AXT44869.1 GIY-YIG nuclease family protein [Chromobacterium rhizoryzae]PTU72215.1 hypothetical protein DBB33_23640 [Chromobacterium haemolyticum]QOD83127.1 GIY-YIG nuclease family protein [Chromobacterium haemolyticum]